MKIKGLRFKGSKFIYFIIILLAITFLNHYLGIYLEKVFQLSFNLKTIQAMGAIGMIASFLLSPIVEELIFRTHLSGKGKHAWSILFMLNVPVIAFPGLHPLIKMLLVIVISISTVLMLLNKKMVYYIQRKYFYITLIFTSVLFSFIHFDVVLKTCSSVSVALIILSAVFLPLSFVFAYIRIKYNLLWVMVFHSLHNILIALLNTYLH